MIWEQYEITKGVTEAVNRRRIDRTMAGRYLKKTQTMLFWCNIWHLYYIASVLFTTNHRHNNKILGDVKSYGVIFLYKIIIIMAFAFYHLMAYIWFMVFNATFNNISVISMRSVLLVEETGDNHRPVASHWHTLSHDVVSSM